MQRPRQCPMLIGHRRLRRWAHRQRLQRRIAAATTYSRLLVPQGHWPFAAHKAATIMHTSTAWIEALLDFAAGIATRSVTAGSRTSGMGSGAKGTNRQGSTSKQASITIALLGIIIAAQFYWGLFLAPIVQLHCQSIWLLALQPVFHLFANSFGLLLCSQFFNCVANLLCWDQLVF